jgi:hypothetical protein
MQIIEVDVTRLLGINHIDFNHGLDELSHKVYSANGFAMFTPEPHVFPNTYLIKADTYHMENISPDKNKIQVLDSDQFILALCHFNKKSF